MHKKMIVVFMLAFSFILMSLYVPAAFAFREEMTLENQIAELFEETMQVPEKSPPQKLLSSCHCIMILLGSGGLPFVSKNATGLMACREHNAETWTGPYLVMMGDWGSGSASASLIVLAMTDKAEKQMTNKVYKLKKLDAKMTTASGPLGWSATVDPKLFETDFIAWSGSKGIVSGVDVNGAYIGQTKSPPKFLDPTGSFPKAPKREKCARFFAAVEKYASSKSLEPSSETAEPQQEGSK